MKTAALILFTIHGLIHLIGFFGGGSKTALANSQKPPTGASKYLWLMVGLFLVVSAGLLLASWHFWWILGLLALLASQVLIITQWKAAKFGTVLNLILVVPCAVGYGVWNIQAEQEKAFQQVEQDNRVQSISGANLGPEIGQADLNRLPYPVRVWIEKSGYSVAKKLRMVLVKQVGSMQPSEGGPWFDFRARQSVSLDAPGFAWAAHVEMPMGLWLSGLDTYSGAESSMRISVLSLIPIVSESGGSKLNESAAIRFLSEMVWYPDYALRKAVSWQEIDSTSAKATMRHGDKAVSGTMIFTPDGRVASFTALRYMGNSTNNERREWTARVDTSSYAFFDGWWCPRKASIWWRTDKGMWEWLRLQIKDVEYLYH